MASYMLAVVIVFLHVMEMVKGDVYCHGPRCSNNRLNERSANRRTGNRLFDSQNNNRGGYNVGDAGERSAGGDSKKQYQMIYFQSGPKGNGLSYFPIEWTNQHGCGQNTPDDPIKLNCQMILQYMCQPVKENRADIDTLRDGVSTARNRYREPPATESADQFRNRKRENQKNSGMNEPYEWRDKCQARPRNAGLFTADQNVNEEATATRQNPNGNRNGYECAEERDYYPYWHPTDWKDIAILVEDKSRCPKLQANSFNVKPYDECVEKFTDGSESHYSKANNAVDCVARGGEWRTFHNFLEKLTTTSGNPPTTGDQCIQLAAAKKLTKADVIFAYAIYGKQKECLVKLKKPDCQLSAYTRVNHLGNGAGNPLQASQYKWKLPHFPSETPQKCVFRIRYNISTEDYDPSNTDSKSNNVKTVISQNPEVDVGLPNDQKLRLAINTAQVGRTFQDRSHTFYVLKRESKMGNSNLINVNVRGKRCNIVQCYPAVEYDFFPNNLTVSTNDMVHFQWTGSNSHDNGNPAGDGQAGDDGQGRGGTDRSNILSMTDSTNNFFRTFEDKKNIAHNVEVIWAGKKVAGGLTPIDICLQFASSGYYGCYNCTRKDSLKNMNQKLNKLLDNAPASFPGMVVKFKTRGVYNYGCTRNNNFSNRSQKACITVTE